MEEKISVEEMLELGRMLSAPPEAPAGIILKAQELLRVRDKEGRERPLTANKVQRAFEAARGQRNIVLKARQMGMTTWISGRFFLKTVSARGVLTVQVAQTRDAAEGIFRIVQRFWECLPDRYRKGALRKSRSNVRQMVFPELDSEFRVLSAADRGAGRGLTMQNLHCSEVSRWPRDARETLAGLRAALSPGGELVLESTANGAYGSFYNEWTGAPENGLARHFFPWWLEETYVGEPAEEFSDEEQELVDRHQLTAEQIGYRRGLMTSFHELRSQEYAEDPESCFRATGSCCFETAPIEQRLQELPQPAGRELHGALLVWMPVVASREYVLAVDTAGGGTDGDFSAAQIIDLESGIQCAELRQQTSMRELAKLVGELATRYNGALVVVERNNHGHAVLAHLEFNRYTNLYEQDGLNGWLTTASSKPRIITRLGSLLCEHPGLFLSKRLLGECRSFVTRANGSTGAAAGAHDDCLMAMAIAQQVRAERLADGARRPR